MDSLKWLERWYAAQCDGAWEHDEGIKITSLDNPGWYVTINLIGTSLESATLPVKRLDRTESDWTHVRIEAGKFIGAGGPMNLEEVISIFRSISGQA